MPDHWTHTKINLVAAPFVLAGAYAFTHDWTLTAVVGVAHMVSTVYLSPDLDLVNSSPEHVWGPFRFLWWPYGKVIHHRSILSHGSALSALLRIAYLLMMVEFIGGALDGLHVIHLGAINDAARQWAGVHQSIVLALVAGCITSDTVHTISDHVSTAIKLRHRSGGKRSHWQAVAEHHNS